MGRALLITVSLLGVIAAATAAGVWAYDASRDDLITPGVTAGGVDVGGMRAGVARAALHERLAARIERPVHVHLPAGKGQFTLAAERARVTTDIEGMVQEALARSRAGNALTRTLRDVRSERVTAEIPVRVSYSRAAVDRLVRRVRRAVERPARDARLSYSATGLRKVRSRDGVALRERRLKAHVSEELVEADGDRTVRARTKVVRPKVSTDDLAERYPAFITVDRKNYLLRFFKDLRHVKSYRIAVGQVGLETPAGLYRIQNKAIDPAWHVPKREWAGKLAGKVIPGGTADNPLKARWMGIYDGAGIHGTADTASLGSSASHGCIRMSVPDVKELYARTPVQTPVFIA